ncbi:MAG: TonB-dependent receptor domain-containing protein, partial [Candidatus Aminicenantes bacterium]
MEFKKTWVKLFLFSFFIFFLAAGFSSAQRLTGKIVGTVTDQDGIPLPGVTVEVSSPSLMGGMRAQVTSAEGSYQFLKLPPGAYTIVFRLEGFQTIEKKNIRVTAGGTVTENTVLKQTTIEESITVTGEAPVIDVTESGMSTNFGKDALEKIPGGRFSYFDIIKQAPGVQQASQDSDRMISFGSNSESNSFRMDGVELSDPDIGIGWLYVSPEIFEEVETMGVGTPAEFGQFTGAVVNIVTKSGGNTFEGSLSYYGQFDSLTDDNNPQPDEVFSYHRDKFYYAAGSLGGPIIKDRLWFFGTYEKYEDSTSWWGINPEYPTRYFGDKIFFKLSAQITNRHKLVGSAYYETFEYPDTQYEWITPEALGAEIGSTPSWNLMYTWQISNNAFFDLKYAGYSSEDNYLPNTGDMDSPPHWDWVTGEVWGGLAYAAWEWKVVRHQGHANLSYFAEDFLGGDHDFKVGVQYNRGVSKYPTGYTGERFYYDYAGYPWYMYQRDVYYVGGVVNSIGGFVDDSWKIGDRLTLNLGLRFDYNNGFIPELPLMDGWTKTSETTPAVEDVVTWKVFSPRIGLAFQLTSDQKTLLKASYGRYYDALLMSNWIYPGPNATDWNIYYYDWSINDWVYWYTWPGGMRYTVDEDLKNPYADILSVGLERELFPNFSIGATFVYKKQKDLIGVEDRGGIYEKVSRVSPDNGQTYEVWNQTNVGTKDLWLTNPSEYEQIYKAFIFTLNKRYSNNWMLSASLTRSKSEGLNMVSHSTSASQQAMVWYATTVGGQIFGEDPNDLINAYGALQSDRPWVFKVQAGYTFPWGILASFNYVYQTGRPAPTFVSVTVDQGWRRILAEPRGEERFPDWSILDFRLQKTFQIYETLRLQAIFDVFNLFNGDTVTYYSSHNKWSRLYLEPSFIFYPRRLQIGLRLE